jgi:hypothetical protein
MKTHLDEDVLLDVMEGRAEAEATRHARECSLCAARVAEAREGFALAASADVPAPSPLFWTAMRSRIAARMDAPARRARVALVAPALFATAAMVAAALYLPTTSPLAVRPSPAALSSPALEPVAMADAPLSVEDLAECRDVAECVAALSDEESRALADVLRAELAGNGDL